MFSSLSEEIVLASVCVGSVIALFFLARAAERRERRKHLEGKN